MSEVAVLPAPSPGCKPVAVRGAVHASSSQARRLARLSRRSPGARLPSPSRTIPAACTVRAGMQARIGRRTPPDRGSPAAINVGVLPTQLIGWAIERRLARNT